MKSAYDILWIIIRGIVCVIFQTGVAYGQEWVRLLSSDTASFHTIRDAAEKYFVTRKYKKKTGWIQYNRWKYFWEQRSGHSGRVPSPAILWNEVARYKNENMRYFRLRGMGVWQPLGPDSWYVGPYWGWNPGVGRINVIAVSPSNSNVIYVGTPGGGLWRSHDGGISWTPLTDNLPVLGVTGIAIDPSNPNIIYIGTGDGDAYSTYSIGVLKSTDGGITWNTTGLTWNTSDGKVIHKLLINPLNPQTLFAASNAGLYKTTNGGISWVKVINDDVYDVEYKPGDTNIVYASSRKFYRSVNGGNSFSIVTAGLPLPSQINRAEIAVTPAAPSYVYFLCGNDEDATFYGLYRSTNNGLSFTLQTNTPNLFGYAEDGSDDGGQSWYDMDIAVSPTNPDEVYVGGVNIWKSVDGGVTFSCLTSWYYPPLLKYVHADIHELVFYGDTLYCGSDGGIYRSRDGGNSWENLTTGLQITEFYRFSVHASPFMILGGTQDNGTNLLKNGVWAHLLGADGMEAIIDHSNPNVLYGSVYFGTIYKSLNGGYTFAEITTGISDTGAWVTPYVMDPINSQILYVGMHYVWKTTDGGNTWTQLNTGYQPLIRSMAIAPSNPNYVYWATYTSIYKSTDGGMTWSNISSGLPVPNEYISYIAVSPFNPDELWVTFSGYLAGNKVFHSVDGGMTWTNISGTLPNLPVNCIAHEYTPLNGLYIGMDVGIYYRNDTMSDWIPYMDGLPNVVVSEIEVEPTLGKVFAATYGRGVWQAPTYSMLLMGMPSTSIVRPVISYFPEQIVVSFPQNYCSTSVSVFSMLGKVIYHASGSYLYVIPLNGGRSGPTILRITTPDYTTLLKIF